MSKVRTIGKSHRKFIRIGIVIIKYCIILGIIGVIIIFILNQYIIHKYDTNLLTVSEAESLDVDCIMVLGAGVWNDGSPSAMLVDRLNQGIELYKLGSSKRLLMSGDHGRIDYDEVNVMKQYAIDDGIEAYRIFMDHAGFSTYESMVRAKEIFEVKTMIIVTQEYHLYRAVYVANELGIEAYGVSSDLRPYYGQKKRDLREIAARVKDFFYVLVKPDPTYLGDVIPISGSGALTDD